MIIENSLDFFAVILVVRIYPIWDITLLQSKLKNFVSVGLRP